MPPKFSTELNRAVIFSRHMDFQPLTSPCEMACPAGNPIQKMNFLVKEKNLNEALIFIRSRNPFPGITGRVCNHPCEKECNRKDHDECIAIRALERFVADHANPKEYLDTLNIPKTGKRLAIIGSGPAGLTCAYFSALFGHEVTLFEGSNELGGIPIAGIPDFRLPKDVVTKEIEMIFALGISAKMNTIVGRDIAFDDIFKEYDACLIATGAWKQKQLAIPNTELAVGGLDFLLKVKNGNRDPIGERVVIVGGGGVAFDCAFTAKRLGAGEIFIVCVEDKENMCVDHEDLLRAEKEGINILNSHMISKILPGNQGAEGIEIYKIASYSFDNSGKLSVSPAEEKKKELRSDYLILAAGLETDMSFAGREFKLTEKGTLKVDGQTMATSVDGVFGAGDAVNGPGTVAEAIGGGRLAAVGINNYLMDQKINTDVSIYIYQDSISMEFTENTPALAPQVVKYDEMLDLEYFDRRQRQPTVQRQLSPQSAGQFEELDIGFKDMNSAVEEADRCFHCGHCQMCGKCVEYCPGYVLEMTETGPVAAFPDECWHCGSCRTNCPSACIFYEFPISMLV